MKVETKISGSRQQAAIPCPFCGAIISVLLENLLHDASVACESCGAALSIDKSISPGIEKLRQLNDLSKAAARNLGGGSNGETADEPDSSRRSRRPRRSR